ncbi:MAG: isopentenyl-diphosphate Delta-isomerase [Bacteroidota bacterium]|jgi:isopentenyl-diphosphate delta-isomerase
MKHINNHVILVNEKDEWIGTCEKLEAHKSGQLHRAFSIFIFNQKGEMLLHKRALNKYHSGGLWTNACCSHPMPGESTLQAAHRRLQEELGFDCPLQNLFTLRYKSSVGNDLIENEYDHIYKGIYDGTIHANEEEVMAYEFVAMEELKNRINRAPQEFTEWFKLAFPKLTN